MPPKKTTGSVQALLLTQKAEVKEVQLVTVNGLITLATIQTLLKKKEAPEVIGTYKHKSSWLFVFGYTTGKAGTENKHELPPPHDSVLCFGDILLLSSKDERSWTTPIPFKSQDYEAFYTRAFGGFEELNSDDEDAGEADADVEAEADVEADVEAEAEADAEEAEEAEEAEDEEEEEEEVVEGDAEEGETEVIAPVRVVKKKKRAAAATVVAGAAQVYASYLHVSSEDELTQESFESPYNADTLPKNRKCVLLASRKLFTGLLNDDEVNQLERCIYNGCIREAGQRHIGKAWSHSPFAEMYTMFAKHIAANFHPNTYVENNELYARYKAGEITFKDISEMDTYQLFEERWKDSFMQQQVREKRQLEGNKAMATDQFLCMRCHKRECTYYEMQTRSADEPMTIFITCLNCGKHWRQ
jgi:DNA-directed RNA polymerase subunit M/transcription elongation factor TFIIS